MRIVCKGPVRAPREPLALREIDADEATVHRILPPPKPRVSKYAGLIERWQRVEEQTGQRFWLDEQIYGQSQPAYHVLRFLALGLARTMFPDNFVEALELRLFVQQEIQWSVMYSKYVHDERGSQARRRAHRRQYENTEGEERSVARRVADGIERGLTPDLVSLAGRMRKEGIVVAHPEANYHVSGGRIVFFEVQEVNGLRLLEAARHHRNREEVLRQAATLYTVAIKEWASREELHQGRGRKTKTEFEAIMPPELFGILYDVFANYPSKAAELIELGVDAVKESIGVLQALTQDTRKRNRVRMGCRIDPQVFEWI